MLRHTPLAILLTSVAHIAQADAPSVVTDIAPVHSLVSMVTEGISEPSLMIEPTASPHTNAMRPSVAGALQSADVVFWIGEELSPWLEDPIETLAPNAVHSALLDVDGIETFEFRETEAFGSHADHEGHDHDEHDDHDHEEAHDHDDHDHEETHDHGDHDDHDHEEAHDHEEHEHEEASHDDHDHDHEEKDHDDHGHGEASHDGHDHGDHDHSGTDPHAWLSPTNAQLWLTHIAETLSEIDPDNAAAYKANAMAGQAAIQAEIDATAASLAAVSDQSFVVFHDAYQYFENQFGLAATGALSLSDAVPPSPSHVADIQAEIREDNVVCVFSEPQYSDGLVQTVIEGTDAKTVELDPLGADLEGGAGLYPALIRAMTEDFVTCLQ